VKKGDRVKALVAFERMGVKAGDIGTIKKINNDHTVTVSFSKTELNGSVDVLSIPERFAVVEEKK
jgi:hypothetical protein